MNNLISRNKHDIPAAPLEGDTLRAFPYVLVQIPRMDKEIAAEHGLDYVPGNRYKAAAPASPPPPAAPEV